MIIQFDEQNPDAVKYVNFLAEKRGILSYFYLETTHAFPLPFATDCYGGVTINGATPFPCPEQAIAQLRHLIKEGHRNYVVKEGSGKLAFTPEMLDELDKEAEENGPMIPQFVEPCNPNFPTPFPVNHPGNVTVIPLAPNKLGVLVEKRPWSGIHHAYPVRCKRVIPQAKLPEYAKDGDSGLDVFAPYNFSIGPGEQLLVMTGWAFELPEGMEFQARPKSGLAIKGEITMTNTPGTIDSNYRGEVGFILRNLSSHKTWGVREGEKIGQLVLCPVLYWQCAFTNGNNEGEIEMFNGDDLSKQVPGVTVTYTRMPSWDRFEHAYKVRCKRLKQDAKLPVYAKEGDSGLDVFATHAFCIGPREQLLVKIGWAFELPEGMEFQARPKSGLANLFRITMTNSPGTVDSNYRGEVGLILHNLSEDDSWNVLAGEKIGQLVLCPVFKAVLEEVDELGETERGAGGFGSTGK